MIKSLLAYLKRLIKKDTKESTKRFLAILCFFFLVAYIVIRFTNHENYEIVLGELLSFILVLLGVASWQSVRIHEGNAKD